VIQALSGHKKQHALLEAGSGVVRAVKPRSDFSGAQMGAEASTVGCASGAAQAGFTVGAGYGLFSRE